MKIGEVITQCREEHGISQRTFARRCGLSNAQISFLERGYGANGKPFEPKFDTIRKVARAMGTTAAGKKSRNGLQTSNPRRTCRKSRRIFPRCIAN